MPLNDPSDQRRPRSKRRLRTREPMQPLVDPRFAGQPAEDHPWSALLCVMSYRGRRPSLVQLKRFHRLARFPSN